MLKANHDKKKKNQVSNHKVIEDNLHSNIENSSI